MTHVCVVGLMSPSRLLFNPNAFVTSCPRLVLELGNLVPMSKSSIRPSPLQCRPLLACFCVVVVVSTRVPHITGLILCASPLSCHTSAKPKAAAEERGPCHGTTASRNCCRCINIPSGGCSFLHPFADKVREQWCVGETRRCGVPWFMHWDGWHLCRHGTGEGRGV